MLASKFRSLLNGGAAEAGVNGLRAEITALETERAKYVAELDDIPARRADLLLGDDHKNAVDKLEARESDLYRFIERIDLQSSALRDRLPQQQDVQYRDLVENHRSAFSVATAAFDEAMIAAVAANEAMAAARQAAVDELGFAGKGEQSSSLPWTGAPTLIAFVSMADSNITSAAAVPS